MQEIENCKFEPHEILVQYTPGVVERLVCDIEELDKMLDRAFE